jgi:hypothetical protein
MHSTYLPDPPLAVGRRPAALWWKRPLDLVLGAIALLAALPLVLQLDLRYLREAPSLDLKVLAMTARAVVASAIDQRP